MLWGELRKEVEEALKRASDSRIACFDKLVREGIFVRADWGNGEFDKVCADCGGCDRDRSTKGE